MRINVVVFMAGLMLTLTGCSQEPMGPQNVLGTMQINMVDSPAAYDAVNVVVDSVQVHVSTASGTEGWITLNTIPATYNLLSYVNGKFAIIGGGLLPAGRCSQLRLFVGTGSTVVVDGSTHPLNIPSGVQTGVKILVNADVQPGATTVVTIDFDANLSVVKSGTPSNPEYSLNPVIRTMTESSGSIEGSVSPSDTRATVWATNELMEKFSTTTDESGGFILHCLPPGVYTISVTSSNALYTDSQLSGISVGSSSTTDVGVVLLSQN